MKCAGYHQLVLEKYFWGRCDFWVQLLKVWGLEHFSILLFWNT
jgi:hypothetical protein